jgi:multidrug efflux system outer membrane protein
VPVCGPVYIEVLDAERQLFSAELQYADEQSLVLNAHVNLYKAMGGGWVEVAEKQAPQPSEG